MTGYIVVNIMFYYSNVIDTEYLPTVYCRQIVYFHIILFVTQNRQNIYRVNKTINLKITHKTYLQYIIRYIIYIMKKK